jgi:hypothetical protein
MKDQPRLLDQVHSVIRVKHYSIRTEKSYSSWIKQFIRFHNLAHPKNMGLKKFRRFFLVLLLLEMFLLQHKIRRFVQYFFCIVMSLKLNLNIWMS